MLAAPRIFGFILLLSLLTLGQSAVALDVAAQVTELEGRAIAIDLDGRTRTLALRGDIFAGDTVATLGKARALLRFTDDSTFELGRDTRMRVDRYRYGPQHAEPEAATEIVRGLFRYVSGLIAKSRPRAIALRTAVATIGIRGTHVIGEVTETSAKIGLLPPATGNAPSAIEVSNAHGSVTIDKPNYVTEIPDANSPPSPPRPMDLRTMTRNLRAVQTMRRIVAPRMPGLH